MVRGIVVSLLCLLAMPSAAQYNIKKMMEEGRRTLDRGYYVASMQIFTRIVALKPNLYEAWYLMALSKYHLEDYKGAGEDCRRALDLQPYIAEIYELYGMVSIREEHYDSAVVAYTHALEISPDNRDDWFNRAYSLYQAGDRQAALRQLDYILRRWKDFETAARLYDDIVAGRRPKPQPVRPTVRPVFTLPGLADGGDASVLMKNRPLVHLPVR
ncbi:tetratricopeptide repeat protein [Prevotella denticola]|uniref:tetratricopeptide repeat protein n=1 Tax=Prevotella denticola TaxID=28129 RepID=UPI0002012E61|nr:tetratricopeptide repeat protein [Prevotella denticola]AEA21630.1 tetratricopeptide repeat protein [Prevotella denticola F0289]QUB89624.1 tetratricopeptide repeat protein [Prevotella denticola]